MTIYPDSSLLVAHYLQDLHSPEVDRRMALHPQVLLTPFHRAEVAHAIYQQIFRRQISTLDARSAYADFEKDCDSGVWILVDLPERAFTTCKEVAQRRVATFGVRTLDSLHVACALELKAGQFWTFDKRQAQVAEAEGLATN